MCREKKNSFKSQLLDKINNRSATVAVVGVGYVGLPLIIALSNQSFGVIGIDVDEDRVGCLREGKSPISHIEDSELKELLNRDVQFTAEFAAVQQVDVVVLCVPTPLGKHREPDLSHVMSATENVARYMKPGQLLSLESTTYPGTTDTEVADVIRAHGLSVGSEVFVVYSPEREDPGNKEFTTATIPKICGGVTDDCRDVGVVFYSAVVESVVEVSSARAAEMTKLLENIHRAVNIGLVNEMKLVADKMGLDIYEVISAAATKPFGFVAYLPGPGLGGHCIPIDPFYLTWKAKEFGVDTKFIELAGEINSSMPSFVTRKIVDALNGQQRSVRGSQVVIIGMAYKKNVGDCRESPAFPVIKHLLEMGAEVVVVDPYVDVQEFRRFNIDAELVGALNSDHLLRSDCIAIVTDHDCLDYELIANSGVPVIDSRGRLTPVFGKVYRA